MSNTQKKSGSACSLLFGNCGGNLPKQEHPANTHLNWEIPLRRIIPAKLAFSLLLGFARWQERPFGSPRPMGTITVAPQTTP